MTAKGGFRGWPPEAFAFYAGLEVDNSKAYWQANKGTYTDALKAPMDEFIAAVTEEFGPLHVFRPHRDVRFSKDKTPYKTAMGAVGQGEAGEDFYVQVSAAGIMAGTGMYAMAADQLARHRAAVDDETTGAELEAIVAGLVKAGYTAGAIDALKTAPKGYPRDHPRVALLRMKGLIVTRQFPVATWMHTAKALARVTDVWRSAAPLNAWLATNVGPSELPPEDLW
jgi:uncharacterized protein (TIGR02453 family)